MYYVPKQNIHKANFVIQQSIKNNQFNQGTFADVSMTVYGKF